jgi:glycosyltransferase involved in cell wall biosynthesis
MKIALIAPEFLPNWGGVGTYCIELAKHLSGDKDVEVHIITLTRCIKGSDVTYTEADILDYFNNKIYLHIVSNAKETFAYNVGFQYQIFRKLPKIIKENGIELLHSQHAHMSDILLKLRNSTQIKIPTVTTIHSTIKTQYQGIKATNPSWLEMDPSERYEFALYPFLLAAEKFYLMNSNNLIFVSHWTENQVKTNYQFANLNTSVIHNGVDANEFSPSKSSDSDILDNIQDPIILYASRLTVARGAHVLARAIPQVLEKNRKVHFVFAGSGNVKPIHDILQANGVPKEKYTLLGYVDYRDLPSLYAKAYAYVMPTSWENLPFKLLEAMSSALPVITTNVGGIPEVIEDGSNGLFVPRNPSNIARSVIQLLNDEQLAKRLGDAARKTVLKNFTWARTVERTKEVYKSMLYAR